MCIVRIINKCPCSRYVSVSLFFCMWGSVCIKWVGEIALNLSSSIIKRCLAIIKNNRFVLLSVVVVVLDVYDRCIECN